VSSAKLPPTADQLVEHIIAVCPLPTSVQRVLTLTNDPDANNRDVVAAVACDPGLAAEVMRLSNSSAFGASRKIGTLSQAIVTLGFRELNKMAAAMGLLVAFRSKDELSLRLHDYGLVAATLSTRFMGEVRAGDAGSAFLCGLLSEVGAMACLAVDAPGYVAIWRQAFEGWTLQSLDPWTVRERLESERYGATAAVIGARLLRRNLLPETVAAAIEVGMGTDPSTLSDTQRVTVISRIVSVFCGTAGQAENPLSPEATIALCAERFGLTSVPLEALHTACLDALRDADRLLRATR
jgi:HD-like signal output (HDOD) protein